MSILQQDFGLFSGRCVADATIGSFKTKTRVVARIAAMRQLNARRVESQYDET